MEPSNYLGALNDVTRQAEALGWRARTRRDGVVTWRYFSSETEDGPSQGWKLHVSLVPDEAAAFVRSMVPRLLSLRLPFKIADDTQTIVNLNNGSAGDSQVGKCVTLYPATAEVFRAAARVLCRGWADGLGPALVSDLLLTHSGHVGMRYGAFSSTPSFVDSVGRVKYAIEDGHGNYVEDVRSKDGSQPPWAPPPPMEPLKKSDLSEPLHVEGSDWVPLAILHSAPKGHVRMVMRTEEPFDLAFAKTALRGVAFSGNGHSAQVLLRREYAIQSALFARGFPCAQPLGFVELPDSSVALSLDLDGEALGSLNPLDARLHLPNLLRLVGRLHDLGYVHRDLKPANVLIVGQGLALIDFELASRIDASDAPCAGTAGFVRGTRDDSSLARDCFALAAIVAWAWLGTMPVEHSEAEQHVALLNLHGMQEPAVWVAQLANGQIPPHGLPALAARIEAFLRTSPSTRPYASKPALQPSCLMQGALAHLEKFQDVPEEGQLRWRNARGEGDTFSEGLYRGTAGVVLSLMTLESIVGESALAQVAPACEWLAARKLHGASAGMFTGNAGVAVVLGVAAERYQRLAWRQAADRYWEAALAAPPLEADLYFGVSGVLWAATLLDAVRGGQRHSVQAMHLAQWLRQKLDTRQDIWHWPNHGTLSADTETPYLGAAHGAAGTAMALSAWARGLADAELQEVCNEVFLRLYMHSQSVDGRQLVGSLGSPVEKMPVFTWCHGVGGYLWCVLQDPQVALKLHQAVAWSIDRIVGAPCAGNSTYCHGLAGRLEMLRMAGRFSDTTAQQQLTVAVLEQMRDEIGRPCVWTSEDRATVSPEMWTGFLAPMTALAMQHTQHTGALISASWLQHLATQRNEGQ